MKKRSEIGYIQKAHGLKGEVFFKLFDDDTSYLSKGLEVYLDDSLYEITGLRLVTGGVILRLAGVEDRNKSDTLKGKTVAVDSKTFEELSGKSGRYLNQLLGFSVILGGVKQGVVSGFAQTEAHDLLKVMTAKGEIELPYVESFINEIKDIEKELYVSCPLELFDTEFFSGGSKK